MLKTQALGMLGACSSLWEFSSFVISCSVMMNLKLVLISEQLHILPSEGRSNEPETHRTVKGRKRGTETRAV